MFELTLVDAGRVPLVTAHMAGGLNVTVTDLQVQWFRG
jgi:hypothetical protein